MSAELYIQSIIEQTRAKNHAAWERARTRCDAARVDSAEWRGARTEMEAAWHAMYPPHAYFTDPYNGASLANALGFCWSRDVRPNKVGMVAGTSLLRLRAMVAERPLTAIDAAFLRKNDLRGRAQDLAADANKWRAFFEEKRAQLIALLDHAIALGEPVCVST